MPTHARAHPQGALELKQQEAARLSQLAAAREVEMEERRKRVARVRSETRPEVGAEARLHFYAQRKGAADDVARCLRALPATTLSLRLRPAYVHTLCLT